MPLARPSVWRRVSGAAGLGGTLLVLSFYAFALAMDIWPMDPLPYRVGQYLSGDVRARLTFEIATPKAALVETGEDELTPASFRLEQDVMRQITEDLEKLPDKLVESSLPAASTQPAAATMPAVAATQPTTRPSQEALLKAQDELLGPGGRAEYDRRLKTLLAELRRQCILRPEEARRQVDRKARTLHLHGAADDVVARPVTAILSTVEDSQIEQLSARQLMAQLAELTKPFAGPVGPQILAYLQKVFVTDKKPLYVYDEQATKKDIVKPGPAAPAAAAKVYRRGEVLVAGSRRQLAPPGGGEEIVAMSASEWELLRVEHEAYKTSQRKSYPWRLLARVAGRAAVLLAAVLALCIYLARYDPQITRDIRHGMRVAVSLALALAMVRIINSALEWNAYAVLLPVMMAAMVMAIAHDQRFALAMGSFVALLAVLQLRASLPLMLVLVMAIVVSVFQLREIRTRSKVIEASGLTALAVFVIVWAQGWITFVPLQFRLVDGLWAGGCAILAGFLIQGLLPLVERLFGMATDMTLLEWCDASKPLLKTLAMQAPGTYSHSLQLGAMCEAGAEAVGARGLLARTGAYYHDVGKINKAEYFVENQAGSASKHAKLSPAMSLLIITGHVKDGLELAREYGLPRVLWEFIASHHGTTLVQYFYQAAAEQRKTSAESAPDEMEFRYPGPKPHSREAAILMLADAAESSVRSMTEPTAGRIENQVHAMINRRLMDGQLDECDLTLKQVHAIEESLVRNLCGIYHPRIAYPTPAGEKPSAAEMPRAKPAGAE